MVQKMVNTFFLLLGGSKKYIYFLPKGSPFVGEKSCIFDSQTARNGREVETEVGAKLRTIMSANIKRQSSREHAGGLLNL